MVQNGKRVRQGCVLSPCLFNLYTEYSMQNVKQNETQTGIKISRRNITNLRYADNTTLMAETWRRQWPPTPVLLHGKSHGRRSLVGYD